MNKFIVLSIALFSVFARAETAEFAAFTGYERCMKVPEAPTGELCSIYLDFKSPPNNSIDLYSSRDGTHSAGSLERDDSQHGFKITTAIQVKKAADGYAVSLVSLGQEEAVLVPEMTIKFDRIEDLLTARKYGPTFSDPRDAHGYYKPFVYLSQSWNSEPLPDNRPLNVRMSENFQRMHP